MVFLEIIGVYVRIDTFSFLIFSRNATFLFLIAFDYFDLFIIRQLWFYVIFSNESKADNKLYSDHIMFFCFLKQAKTNSRQTILSQRINIAYML